MIASRVALGAAFALFSLTVSVDPAVTAASARTPARPHRPSSAAPREAGVLTAAPPEAPRAPPSDLKVEISRDSAGHRVVMRRPGHLVALQYGAARAAGKDWASVRVEVATAGAARKPAGVAEALQPLVWETTPLSALTTDRGLIALRLEGTELRADASSGTPPEPAGASSGPHHTCAAHRDPQGGFTVLCRLHHGARRVSVANVTGPRVLDDAWVTADKDPLVRLDLPLAVGGAEARVIGFTHGLTGAVLRAEATWAEGEAPSLLIEETERSQPVTADLAWR